MSRQLIGLVASSLALTACSGYNAQPVRAGRDLPPAVLYEPAANDHGDQLVVQFGDSLSQLSATQTLDLFVADADLRLSAQFYGGTEFDTAAWREGYPQVAEGAIVLLFLGTNDVVSDPLSKIEDDAAAAIDAVTASGASRVVLATVNTTGNPTDLGPDWSGRVERFNDMLREVDRDTDRYPAVDVVDWDQISKGHAEWLEADGVHLTEAGQVAYAQMTLDASRAALTSVQDES